MSKPEKRKLGLIVDSDEENGMAEVLVHDSSDQPTPFQRISLEANPDIGGEMEEFEFDIVELKEDDYQWVREQLTLPRKFTSLKPVEFSKLTEKLVTQNIVGGITKSGACPIGFLTALSSRLEDEVILKVRESILSAVTGKDRINLEEQLQKYHVGFVFMEKLVNYPFGMIHPLHDSFAQDLTWIVGPKSSLSIQEKQQFQFERLLFYCQRESEPRNECKGEDNSMKKRAKGPNIKVFFADVEMDLLKAHAETVIDCSPISRKTFNNQTITRQPCLLIFKLEDYNRAVNDLKQLE